MKLWRMLPTQRRWLGRSTDYALYRRYREGKTEVLAMNRDPAPLEKAAVEARACWWNASTTIGVIRIAALTAG